MVEEAEAPATQPSTPAPPVPTPVPAAETAQADVTTASTLTEPSPAQTPLVPPPGTQQEPRATPAATPATETSPLPPEPFADELPPDFWGDALEPPPPASTSSEPSDTLLSTASSTEPVTPIKVTAPDRPAAPAPSAGAAKPLEGSLQKDPRFVLLQELFPGHISDWQAESVANSSESGEDEAADAPGEPETVDLEEGLDADETVS